ncbi:hypothetical protein EUX98_g1935 [Antrodiella citrinella]|uniref:Uncharacterized protein n=1 Tax=Antrodiella citrinella TaxID=2447956 RepID=A0A4S4N2J5_9APHY|nr:hypothetical protein EUX98_g1935 [Antrodiella citrinella]
MASAPAQFDVVSGEQYRYALTNFRIAHEKVEEQRQQMQEQEKQVAALRARIALLEGTNQEGHGMRTSLVQQNTVDDFSIKTAASKLEREINRWAADFVRLPPCSLTDLRHAALTDIFDGYLPETDPYPFEATGMQVQNLLRHAMSQTISEGIINCLIVTDSPEANIQLTRVHEHIFSRTYSSKYHEMSLLLNIIPPTGDATVAAVWRRQTFTAAVERCSADMSRFFLDEHMPALTQALYPGDTKNQESLSAFAILDAGYDFSRMLHGAPSNSGGTADSFYRGFVPELGSNLSPRQVELVKRCQKSERGEQDKVGATVFPGLVKVTRGVMGPNGQQGEHGQTVMRRAQVICECALFGHILDKSQAHGV